MNASMKSDCEMKCDDDTLEITHFPFTHNCESTSVYDQF